METSVEQPMDPDGGAPPMAIRCILVGHDGSDGASSAVTWVAGLAAQSGCEVSLVHAFEPLVAMEHARPPVDFHQLKEQARLDAGGAWSAPLRDAGVTYRTQVLEGKALEVLAAAADDEAVGLVVIGSHGRRGWSDRVFGTVVTRLAATLTVPLAVVPLPRPAS
jgi:nucleotide-binding universal stress UspA family protein